MAIVTLNKIKSELVIPLTILSFWLLWLYCLYASIWNVFNFYEELYWNFMRIACNLQRIFDKMSTFTVLIPSIHLLLSFSFFFQHLKVHIIKDFCFVSWVYSKKIISYTLFTWKETMKCIAYYFTSGLMNSHGMIAKIY